MSSFLALIDKSFRARKEGALEYASHYIFSRFSWLESANIAKSL